MQFSVRKLKEDDELVNTVPPIIFTEVEQMAAKVESLIADADVYKSEDNWDHKQMMTDFRSANKEIVTLVKKLDRLENNGNIMKKPACSIVL